MGLADFVAGQQAVTSTAADTKSTKAVSKAITTGENRLASAGTPQSPTLESYANQQQTFSQQAQGQRGNMLENWLASTLELAARPAQANLQALHEFSGKGTGIFDPSTIASAVKAYASGLTDVHGEHDTSLAAAENKDLSTGPLSQQLPLKYTAPGFVPIVGGKSLIPTVGGILDLTGSSALDPTMGIGRTSGIAREAGLKELENGTSKELADEVAKNGVRNLTPEQQTIVEAALRNSPAAAKAGPDAYVKTMLGGTGRLSGESPGALTEPAGLTMYGRTVVPTSAVSGAADLLGITAAKDMVAATRVGTAVSGLRDAVAKPFIKREPLATGISKQAAEDVGRFETARASQAGFKTQDAISKLNYLAQRIPHADQFSATEVGPALERGEHTQLISQLKERGETVKAQYVRELDKLRKATTQERLSTGAIKPHQVLNQETRVPRVATKEFREYLADPANTQLAQRLGYAHPATGVFSSIGPHFRNIKADTTAEANDIVHQATGGKVAKAFEEDPAKAIVREATGTFEESAKLNILHDLEKYDAGSGTPLAVKITDQNAQLKSLRNTIKAKTDEIDKKIERLTREGAERGERAKLATGKLDGLNRAAETVQKRLDGLQEQLPRLQRMALAGFPYAKVALGDVYKQIKSTRTAADQIESARYVVSLQIPKVERTPLGKLVSHEKLTIESLRAQRNGLLAAERDAKEQLRTQITKPPTGYVKLDAGPLGAYYAHPSAAEYLRGLEARAKEPGAFKQLADGIAEANNGWRNLTLNGIGFAQARVSRDFMDNMMQMWQAGWTDTSSFKPAFKIAKALITASKHGLTRAEAVANAGLDPEAATILKEMESVGAIDAGRIRSDIKHAGIATGSKERRLQKLDPRNAESYLTQHGSRLSQFVDDVSRIAMFTDQYRKLGDAAAAAKQTDRALFNYRDLAKGEQAIRRHVPFYTYTARNTQLQLWALSHAPGKTEVVEHLKNQLANDQANGTTVDPQYAIAQGQVPIMNVGGMPIFANVQTPLEAAGQTIQPLVDIGSQFLPHQYVTQAGVAGGVGQLGQNLGGIVPNAARDAVQESSGKNLATGAPLSQGQYDFIKRAIEAQAPRATSYEGLVRNSVGSQSNAASRTAQALKLLGASATAVTPQSSTSELYRRKAALDQAAAQQHIQTVAKLKKQGKYKTNASSSAK